MIKPENWLKKRTWIGALALLRAAYVVMNEYGKNPFKKNLQKDHVFLTGAGGGIGRLMAIKLGKLGCMLSLSDVNMEGLKQTQVILEENGISPGSIYLTQCDVSNRKSIKQAAE